MLHCYKLYDIETLRHVLQHKRISSTGPEPPTSCEELVCSYGATCIEVNDQAHCECPSPDCDEKNKTKVGLTERFATVSLSGLQGGNMCSHVPSLHLCLCGAGVRLRRGDLRRPVPAEDHRLQAGQGHHGAALRTVHR